MINKYPFCFVIDVYSISLHKKGDMEYTFRY